MRTSSPSVPRMRADRRRRSAHAVRGRHLLDPLHALQRLDRRRTLARRNRGRAWRRGLLSGRRSFAAGARLAVRRARKADSATAIRVGAGVVGLGLPCHGHRRRRGCGGSPPRPRRQPSGVASVDRLGDSRERRFRASCLGDRRGGAGGHRLRGHWVGVGAGASAGPAATVSGTAGAGGPNPSAPADAARISRATHATATTCRARTVQAKPNAAYKSRIGAAAPSRCRPRLRTRGDGLVRRGSFVREWQLPPIERSSAPRSTCNASPTPAAIATRCTSTNGLPGRTPYGRCVAQGALVTIAGLSSADPDALHHVRQLDIQFKQPVFPGETYALGCSPADGGGTRIEVAWAGKPVAVIRVTVDREWPPLASAIGDENGLTVQLSAGTPPR